LALRLKLGSDQVKHNWVFFKLLRKHLVEEMAQVKVLGHDFFTIPILHKTLSNSHEEIPILYSTVESAVGIGYSKRIAKHVRFLITPWHFAMRQK